MTNYTGMRINPSHNCMKRKNTASLHGKAVDLRLYMNISKMCRHKNKNKTTKLLSCWLINKECLRRRGMVTIKTIRKDKAWMRMSRKCLRIFFFFQLKYSYILTYFGDRRKNSTSNRSKRNGLRMEKGRLVQEPLGKNFLRCDRDTSDTAVKQGHGSFQSFFFSF